MATQKHDELIERINRIVLERGDPDLLMLLDRLMDKRPSEQAAELARVIAIINQSRKDAQ